MKDFYYILGVDENCSADVIKDAYRKLSKKFHPDMNPGDKYFESRFRDVQEAYELLSDPGRRRRYNAALKNFRSQEPVIEQKKPKFTTKPIDIAFTIILIALTFIFGDYVLKAMNGHPKPKITTKIIATDSLLTYNTTFVHHRKRHKLNLKTHSPNTPDKFFIVSKPVILKQKPKLTASSIPAVSKFSTPVVQVAPKPTIVLAQATPKTMVRPVADSNKAAQNKNYLYTAHINSNVTGQTNLRRANRFGSPVINTIPDNSEVVVLERGNSYYKVLYKHEMGYVPKWSLDKK